jgi:HEAT repeat protein
MIQLLLYALARDEDTGYLIRIITQNSKNLLCLAEHAVTAAEPEAKYQLAAAIGRLGLRSPQAESILLQFAHDDDEYVRRWGLMASADIESPHVTELVSAAWDTEDEHARIGVLYALGTINAPQLEDYLRQADLDGREYLVGYANKIRAGEPID